MSWVTKLKGMLFRDNSRLHKRFITFLDNNDSLEGYLIKINERDDYDPSKPLTEFLTYIDNRAQMIRRSGGTDYPEGYWYLKVFVWDKNWWSMLHDAWVGRL